LPLVYKQNLGNKLVINYDTKTCKKCKIINLFLGFHLTFEKPQKTIKKMIEKLMMFHGNMFL
jgi:hypothetical protein